LSHSCSSIGIGAHWPGGSHRNAAVTVPNNIASIPGAGSAWILLDDAYRTRLRRAGRNPHHAIDVAEVLIAARQPASVVVAGLLHDVLEDTHLHAAELSEQIGTEICRTVEALTEDRTIRRYRCRKAELRRKILDGGPDAAAVALADKIAKLRVGHKRPKGQKLEHYRATLSETEARYGKGAPLSVQLQEELARWK
jgi:(p)ppGpp synthase/HD superfamily hydrolase